MGILWTKFINIGRPDIYKTKVKADEERQKPKYWKGKKGRQPQGPSAAVLALVAERDKIGYGRNANYPKSTSSTTTTAGSTSSSDYSWFKKKQLLMKHSKNKVDSVQNVNGTRPKQEKSKSKHEGPVSRTDTESRDEAGKTYVHLTDSILLAKLSRRKIEGESGTKEKGSSSIWSKKARSRPGSVVVFLPPNPNKKLAQIPEKRKVLKAKKRSSNKNKLQKRRNIK